MEENSKKPLKRIFVLDTNVVIHDPTAIFQFAEHDIVIPMTVLEEVDKLKNGSDLRNLAAREFLRNLKKIIKENPDNNNDGYILGDGLGKLTFEIWESYPEGFTCKEDINDHRILCIAYNLTEKYKDSDVLVTLVTKDVNLQLKARALKVHAEDYTHDMVQAIELESQILHKSDSELKKLKPGEKLLYLNSPIIVHHDSKGDNDETDNSKDDEDRIGRWDGKKCNLISRRTIGDTGIKAKNIEQDFAVNILMDPSITAAVLGGSAGSGKTLLAVACGIEQRKRGLYDHILVGRPAIELSDKTIGFQPGDTNQKYKPYLTPIGSACRIIMDNVKTKGKSKSNKKNQEHESDDVVEKWMKDAGIELLPLSMIRGNTFPRAYIIIDEAQNLTPNEIKTIVSRAGEGTKIVFTGDNNQIDVRYLSRESNGPSHLVSRFKGQPYFAYIEMQTSVRSPLAEAADKLL